jgi:hypothetical protein
MAFSPTALKVGPDDRFDVVAVVGLHLGVYFGVVEDTEHLVQLITFLGLDILLLAG